MFTVVACPNGADDGPAVVDKGCGEGTLAAHDPRIITVTIAKARTVAERSLTMLSHGPFKVKTLRFTHFLPKEETP